MLADILELYAIQKIFFFGLRNALPNLPYFPFNTTMPVVI